MRVKQHVCGDWYRFRIQNKKVSANGFLIVQASSLEEAIEVVRRLTNKKVERLGGPIVELVSPGVA